MNNKYYDIKPLLELNAEYNIIFGERSNGKTYSVLKLILERWLKDHNDKGVYMRRYDDEIDPAKLKTLFSPFDEILEKMSKKKFNRIIYRSKAFHIGKYDWENEEWVTKPETFCYCSSINTYENNKGADRGHIKVILFDEVITRRPYLTNEFICFQNALSTYMRDRGDCQVFLVGNSVSFYCPYFREFNIENVKDMNPGDLNCYTFENGVKIAVNYTESVGTQKASAKFFNFSEKAKMITTGKWEIPNYPHFPKSINFRKDVKMRFYIIFNEEQLCCCITHSPEGYFLYVHQQTKDIDPEEFIYSTEFDNNVRHCRSFRQGTLPIHKTILQFINSGKIFFADNTAGEIFTQYYQWQMKASGDFSIS